MKLITTLMDKLKNIAVNWPGVVLLSLMLFHGVNNWIVLSQSRYAIDADEANYYVRIHSMTQLLRDTEFSVSFFHRAINDIFSSDRKSQLFFTLGMETKPPLFFILAVPFALFSTDKNVLYFYNTFFLLLLILATYLMGKKIYNSTSTGLLAAFLVSMFPGIFAASRSLMIDLAVAAMVALTFYRMESYSEKSATLNGLIMGLGIWTKQSYLFFLFPILAYSLFQGGIEGVRKSWTKYLWAVGVAFIAGALYFSLAGLDYILNFVYFHRSPLNPYYYLLLIYDFLLLPVFSVGAIVSLCSAFKHKRYAFSALVLVMLFMQFSFPVKEGRFLLPIFPFLAVTMAGFILSFRSCRVWLTTAVVLFSLWQYSTISYGLPGPHFLLGNLPGCQQTHEGIYTKAIGSDFESPIYETLQCRENEDSKMLIIDEQGWAADALGYLLVKEKKSTASVDFFGACQPFRLKDTRLPGLAQYDYVVLTKSKYPLTQGHLIQTLKDFRRTQQDYDLIKSINFPDGTQWLVYEKKTVVPPEGHSLQQKQTGRLTNEGFPVKLKG